MKKHPLLLLVALIVSLNSHLSLATDSRFIMFGNGNYDFSSTASCAPKKSSAVDKLADFSQKMADSQPLVINVNGKSCLVHEENKSAVNAIFQEMITNPSQKNDDQELKRAFPKEEVSKIKESSNLTVCDNDIEKWVISSFAHKTIQPYNIAGIGVSHLSEIKLLIVGGGIVAEIAGDHVGATCMSVIGAGVSYACDKGWLYEK